MQKTNHSVACQRLIQEVLACTACDSLPLGPRPILQFSKTSKILIAGQAPGRITHAKGIPFDDPSGNRLRDWLGMDRQAFYDPSLMAIIPMAFCFPGTGKGGDLAPPPQCAELWRAQLLQQMQAVELTIIIGKYALDWHLPETKGQSVTDIVKNWREYWPSVLPLPHPSPRNNRWLKNNPWFAAELLPVLKAAITEIR